MRIQGNWKLLSELPEAGFILLLSFLLITYGGRIEVPSISGPGVFWLSVLPAFLIANAFGLALHEQSRRGSLFLLAGFLPVLHILSQHDFLSTNGLVLGFLAGSLLDLQILSRNQFSSLARYARSGSRFFFLVLSYYLLIRLLEFVYPFSIEGIRQAFEISSEELNNLGIAFLAVFFLLMSTTFIRGIQASEVFVYGPSRSGKTLLLLALYSHFVDFYEGTHREIILSFDREEEKVWQLSQKSEKKLRIESMLAELEEGITPKSTNRTDLAIYELSGKKNGLLPVEFTFIDYGGEYTEDLEPKKYSRALRSLSEKLSRNEKLSGNEKLPGFSVEALHRQIGTLSFLKLLKNKYSKEVGDQFHNLILACIYKKMKTAGKVIFLVDGDYILDYHGEGRKELTTLFGHYFRLMDQLGPDKSYALVLTKTDKLKDLSEIPDNSEKAGEIEAEIYSLLDRIYTFREIQNLAKRIPIYFYTVSVDATLSPQASKDLPEEQQGITQIFPWRVGEIAKFGF